MTTINIDETRWFEEKARLEAAAAAADRDCLRAAENLGPEGVETSLRIAMAIHEQLAETRRKLEAATTIRTAEDSVEATRRVAELDAEIARLRAPMKRLQAKAAHVQKALARLQLEHNELNVQVLRFEAERNRCHQIAMAGLPPQKPEPVRSRAVRKVRGLAAGVGQVAAATVNVLRASWLGPGGKSVDVGLATLPVRDAGNLVDAGGAEFVAPAPPIKVGHGFIPATATRGTIHNGGPINAGEEVLLTHEELEAAPAGLWRTVDPVAGLTLHALEEKVSNLEREYGP
jgi:hypothetical protein